MKGLTSAVIRKAELRDLERITEIYNWAVENSTATFDLQPKSIADQKIWFENHDQFHPVFIASIENHVVGWASLSAWSDRCAYSESGEVSVYIDPQFHGKGVGTLLLKQLIDCARQMQMHTLLARITSESLPSIALHKKLGFELVGTLRQVGKKFGRRLDVYLFQNLLDKSFSRL